VFRRQMNVLFVGKSARSTNSRIPDPVGLHRSANSRMTAAITKRRASVEAIEGTLSLISASKIMSYNLSVQRSGSFQ